MDVEGSARRLDRATEALACGMTRCNIALVRQKEQDRLHEVARDGSLWNRLHGVWQSAAMSDLQHIDAQACLPGRPLLMCCANVNDIFGRRGGDIRGQAN